MTSLSAAISSQGYGGCDRAGPRCSTDLRVVGSLFRERLELVYGAFERVAAPVGASRVDCVIVRRHWLETLDTHSEKRVWMGHVQSDGRFGRLTQVIGIGAVVNDAEVFRRTRRCGAHPSDDSRFFCDRFERGTDNDLYSFGLHSS